LNFLPDLATSTPLWLAVTTVGVNAIVGALRASIDDERHWDIVGLSTFGVLMGLGGGFIRDLLVGNRKKSWWSNESDSKPSRWIENSNFTSHFYKH
jgi:uncharacterized membrane protein YeiH